MRLAIMDGLPTAEFSLVLESTPKEIDGEGDDILLGRRRPRSLGPDPRDEGVGAAGSSDPFPSRRPLSCCVECAVSTVLLPS